MATLKSRQVLADRQSSAKTSNKIYTDPNTWQRMAMTHKRVVQSKNWVDWVENPLGVVGGVVANSLQKVVTGEVFDNTSFEGASLSSGLISYTKLWRYKILMKGTNGMERTQFSPRPTIDSIVQSALPTVLQSKERDEQNYHTTRPFSLSAAEKAYPGNEPNKIQARRMAHQGGIYTPAGINYVQEKFKALEGFTNRRHNDIIIINDSVSPYQKVILQNRPNELNIDPKSSWVSVSSMGRNNPFMMYAGGEDTISFDVSWYANDPTRRDEVLWKCKLLESWTRADGYLASPPVLRIKWGSSEIFKDTDCFILESAKYTLTHFQDRARKVGQGYDEALDLKLNPNCATQTLVFKRITMVNTTHEDIVPLSKLQGIQGIQTQ